MIVGLHNREIPFTLPIEGTAPDLADEWERAERVEEVMP